MMVEYRPFSEAFEEVSRLIPVEDDVEYRCAGVRLHGLGVFVREYKMGSEIRKKHVQHLVEEGDVVYSTLFANKGAFAVADASVDGAILSEKFPTFRIVGDDINRAYLSWFFRSGMLASIASRQVTGMAAFSLSHLSKTKFNKLVLPVPELAVQQAVVERCESMAAHFDRASRLLEKLEGDLGALTGTYTQALLQDCPVRRLGEIGDYVTDSVEIDPVTEYKQITVAMHNAGLRLRRFCMGSDIRSPGQCRVRTNDLLFSRIDLRQGAIGFVGEDLDGGVVTRDFPVFRLHENGPNDRTFLEFVLRTRDFLQQAIAKSRGTSNRQKIKRDAFLDIRVPWPERRTREQKVIQLAELSDRASRCVQSLGGERSSLMELPRNFLERSFAF